MSAFIPYKNFDYVLGKQVNRPDLPALVWNPDGRDTNNPHGLIHWQLIIIYDTVFDRIEDQKRIVEDSL